MAFALVESGKITKLINGNKGIKIGDTQYPSSFFSTIYSEAARNAAGVYTIELDSTNRKHETYYINTDITYSYDSSANKVKGVYGSATEKPVNDVKWTQAQIDDPSLVGPAPAGADTNTVRIIGLKTKYKEFFNKEAARLLEKTDWYVIKAADVESYSVPSNIKTYRAAVRTKVNEMETVIDNCADVAALETLLSYKTGTRPLGEFPDEVV